MDIPHAWAADEAEQLAADVDRDGPKAAATRAHPVRPYCARLGLRNRPVAGKQFATDRYLSPGRIERVVVVAGHFGAFLQ
jgi:hypothetical protein